MQESMDLGNGRQSRRPSVLVMCDWYAPGYRAGGPIRSVVHFAEQLEADLDIHVLTTDRDHGCEMPYPDIVADQWLAFSKHRVFYASPSRLGWSSILAIIRGVRPDYLYLNSMFSRYMTVYPLLMHRMGLVKGNVLLAPRGMLMQSALAGKSFKKRIFIALLKGAGIPHRIRFQATNELEAGDIRRKMGTDAPVARLENLAGQQPAFTPPPFKEPGILRVVFIGRSHPIKNLDLLLRAIHGVRARIELTAVLSQEDEAYARQCRDLAASLPGHHSVFFQEGVPHKQIGEILRGCHIFALPTRGENFGHAIYESLAAGRPVMVSDQTPWRQLDSRMAGWDLPIQDEGAFRDQLEAVAAMDNEALLRWCRAAWQMASEYLQASQSVLKASYLEQFE